MDITHTPIIMSIVSLGNAMSGANIMSGVKIISPGNTMTEVSTMNITRIKETDEET
jgi:hypothetical protein